MSWLETIPVCSTVYAHDASLICEDCAKPIIARLRARGEPEDSGRYPDGPYPDGGGESDTPNFCAMGASCVNAVKTHFKLKVGCPLGNPLTATGVEYLLTMIAKDLLSASKEHRKFGRLLHHVWKDYSAPPKMVEPMWMSRGFPKSLERAIRGYEQKVMKTGGIPVNVLADAEAIYLIYPRVDTHSVDALRCLVDDEGEFKKTEIASIALATYSGPEPLAAELVSEGAWD